MESILELWHEKITNVFGIVVLAMSIGEWVLLVILKTIKSNKEGFINVMSWMIESIPYIFLGPIFIFGMMNLTHEYRFMTLGFEWYIWVLAYLAYDLMFYLVHYLGHQVRFFWCIHGVHHTATEMKLTVSIRGSFLGFFHSPLTIIFLPLFGFPPIMLYLVEAFQRMYGFYEHISDSLVGQQPSLERVLVTPSVHRIHHSKNHVYLDRNYGQTFSIWDHLFRTFQTELKEEKPQYGLMNDAVDSESYWQIQFIFWRDLWTDIKSASKFSDKLKYIVMPPGWNHIDGGKLAHVYRKEALRGMEGVNGEKSSVVI